MLLGFTLLTHLEFFPAHPFVNNSMLRLLPCPSFIFPLMISFCTCTSTHAKEVNLCLNCTKQNSQTISYKQFVSHPPGLIILCARPFNLSGNFVRAPFNLSGNFARAPFNLSGNYVRAPFNQEGNWCARPVQSVRQLCARPFQSRRQLVRAPLSICQATLRAPLSIKKATGVCAPFNLSDNFARAPFNQAGNQALVLSSFISFILFSSGLFIVYFIHFCAFIYYVHHLLCPLFICVHFLLCALFICAHCSIVLSLQLIRVS
jgi:hypothetical protein